MKRAYLLVALVALTACTRKLDGTKIEKSLTEFWTEAGPVEKVSCPKTIDMKEGAKFTCTLVFVGGEKFTLDGSITNVKDKTANWETLPTEEIFKAKVAQDSITKTIDEKFGPGHKVDCGAPRHMVDHKATCTMVAPDASKHNVEVTLSGTDLAWKVLD